MKFRQIAIISAPSNLGLRPPEMGTTPGVAKAPEALREAGLQTGLISRGAVEAGVVLSGRYRDDWQAGTGTVRNQAELLAHAHRLDQRVSTVLDGGYWPLVLGGDCSILLGIGTALKRRGHYGLIHLDGHTDFRNPWNSAECASVAGEDLAVVTGRHFPALADVDWLGPYFAVADVVHAGCREDDGEIDEVRAYVAGLFTSGGIRESPTSVAAKILAVFPEGLAGIWLQLDIDILDPRIMPAVDGPDPDGIDWSQVEALLLILLPSISGLSLTVFDPELDPDGELARTLSEFMLRVLA